MVKDAEAHAEDDRQQRELVEARNNAENAAYQAEKQLGELGDQVDSGAREEIERAIKEVREALEQDDLEQIKSKTDALQQAFHKVSERIYQAAAEQQQATGAPASDGSSTDGAAAQDEEEVVDAEVVDEDRS